MSELSESHVARSSWRSQTSQTGFDSALRLAPAGSHVVHWPAMNLAAWIGQNWFTLLQSLGIIASLLFTAYSLRLDVKIRRVENLFVITEHHRAVWRRLSERPGLERVLDERVDTKENKVTREEEIFVNSVLFHLNGVFYAQKTGLAFDMEGLKRDVRWFFSLPIPRAVWGKARPLQNVDFIEFMAACQVLE